MAPKNIQMMLMAMDAVNVCHHAQAQEQVEKESIALLMSMQIELLNFVTYDSQRFFIDPSRELIIEWASARKGDKSST
jgi:hypothetical protein